MEFRREKQRMQANIISIHSFQICSICKISLLVDKVVQSVARRSAEETGKDYMWSIQIFAANVSLNEVV